MRNVRPLIGDRPLERECYLGRKRLQQVMLFRQQDSPSHRRFDSEHTQPVAPGFER